MKMSKQDREWLSSHTKFSLGLSVDDIEAMQAEVAALLDQIKQVASDNHALEAENAALRAVAAQAQRLISVAAKHTDWQEIDTRLLINNRLLMLYTMLRHAGYLAGVEEVQP